MIFRLHADDAGRWFVEIRWMQAAQKPVFVARLGKDLCPAMDVCGQWLMLKNVQRLRYTSAF